jgi:hypothetical protein
VRVLLIPFLVVVGLLLIALVLPSKRDTSVAAWWTRVRYQADFYARVALVLVLIGMAVWYVVLPLFGWRLTP